MKKLQWVRMFYPRAGWLALMLAALAVAAAGCQVETLDNGEPRGRGATGEDGVGGEGDGGAGGADAGDATVGGDEGEALADGIETDADVDVDDGGGGEQVKRTAPKPVERLRPTDAKKVLEELSRRIKRTRSANLVKANHHYAAGRRLYDTMQYEAAIREFETALRYFPNHIDARRHLRKARNLMGVHTDVVREALDRYSREKRVRIQELLIELDRAREEGVQYHDSVRQPPELLGLEMDKETRFTRKIQSLRRAIERYERVLEISRWMPYEIDLSGTENEVKARRDEAEREKAETEEDLRNHQRRVARDQASQQRGKEQEIWRLKIGKLTTQAQVLFRKEKYEDCEKLCLRILQEDPNNEDIQDLARRARQKKHIRDERRIYRAERHEYKLNMLDVERASIPFDRRIIYPDYWERVKQRAEKGLSFVGAEEQWKQDIRRSLQKKVSFEFVDTPLHEALRFLQDLAEANIILDQQVMESGTGDTPINLKIGDMSLNLALDWILRLADLSYALKDDAIFISTPDRLTEDVVMQIYDVADLVGTVPDFPGPDFALQVGGRAGSGSQGAIAGQGITLTPVEEDEGAAAASLAEMIESRVKPGSWAVELGTSIEQRGNKLIVMQQPEVHRLIQSLLESLRAAEKLLVTVEARFLTIREGFFEEIGFNWGGPIPGATGMNNPLYNNTTSIPFDLAVAPATDMIIPTINSQSLNTSVATGFVAPARSVDYFGRGVLYTIGAVTNNYIGYSPENTPITVSDPTGARLREGLNASITHIGNIEAQAMLHMLRIRETRSTLSAPRLTCYNRQRAHMFVAEQQSYVADYEISGDAYDPVVRQFLQGVIFDVRPTVSADRRYITLELRPTTIELVEMTRVEIQSIQILDAATTTVVFSISLPIQFPVLQITKVRTTATIPDGGILLIGGLMQEIKFKATTGIPFLSNIPILGRLFRWDVEDNEKRNMVIMVTARILMFDEEERKLQ